MLAFAYTQEPIELSLAAERRKPQVTVRQLLVARVEEGVVKYQVTFFYNVLYSGVKSLRIDVPAEVAGGLRVATPGVREKTIDPPPADLAKDYVAWSLTGESELMGDGKIELTWEKKIEKLDVGKSVELPLPYLKPQEVDRAWGQIVLVKSETIDVHESGEPKSLRPIDPQHDLMTPVAAAARAFEFHDDWTLSIAATRYQLEEVKRTSIERAVVRMVVTPAKIISVQALYRMRSVQQRLAVAAARRGRLRHPAAADQRPAGDAGEGPAERVLRAAGGRQRRHAVRAGASLHARRATAAGSTCRSFPQEPAVVKAYLCVYLPETRTLLGVRGPWTEEFHWQCDPTLRWQPSPRDRRRSACRSGSAREWLCPSSPAEDFQTDGRLYVYSTLRPAAGPKARWR